MARFWKRHQQAEATQRGKLWPHALALAGVALLVLPIGFVFYHLMGGLTAVAQLGQWSVISVTLFIASVIAPVAVVMAGISLLRRASQPKRLISLIWGGGLTCLLAALSILLIAYGLIPFLP